MPSLGVVDDWVELLSMNKISEYPRWYGFAERGVLVDDTWK